MKPIEVRLGEWLFTTREGAEADLVEELALEKVTARVVGPALVASTRAPRKEGRIELTFARQTLPVDAILRAPAAALPSALASEFARSIGQSPTFVLHVWVPDAESTNTLAQAARELHVELSRILAERFPTSQEVDAREVGPGAIPLLQVCLRTEAVAIAGTLPASRALSLAPGGRLRVRVGGDKPSRSARKVAEALLWLGVTPEPGELCVDLGAAPGGWTFVLLEHKARVIAVDPGRLRPDLLQRKGLKYIAGSAFDYHPDEPADWLFCDMAWRPLEVAQLLARWARQGDATLLVANFKLPMKRKAEMVRDLRSTLEGGGWKGIRCRQLYHDRDEVTFTARTN